MSTYFCNEYICRELLGPPPIPPADLLPRNECQDILSSCHVLSSLKRSFSNYSDPCFPPVLITAATTSTELISTTSKIVEVITTNYPKLVTETISDYSTTASSISNVTKTSQTIFYAGFPAWLIGVIVVAVIALIIVIIIIVACIVKSTKGESPERRADYVLSDYHRVNYLHNKLEKGQKYKRKKKKKSEGNASNNNIEDGCHDNLPTQKPANNGSCEGQAASSRAGYDELSKCYTRQSNTASISSEQQMNGHLVSDGDLGAFTLISEVDVYPESTTSDQKDERIYTPTVIDGDADSDIFLFNRGSKKECAYAISDVLPNVPVNYSDDVPPPAPHGFYANHQFEKLGGFRNRSFIDDEEHRRKPLPPNPFPDLKSHTSLIGTSLYDNPEESGLYKKNKKPIPKKRQKMKADDDTS